MNVDQQFYNVNEVYVEKYYQLPQWLFTNENYKNMKNDSKVAYALLKDRNSLSIANHLFDEKGNIYFVYTNSELAKMLNISKHSVVRVKNELVDYGLLYVQKMGFNKKLGKNLPSRLYLLKPILSTTDVYNRMSKVVKKETSALEQSGSAKNALPKKETSALEQSGSAKNALPEKEASALEQSGSAKNALYQDYNLEDTKKIHKDTQLDFSSNKYSQMELNDQNFDLVKNSADFMTKTDSLDTFVLNQDAVNVLSMWVRTPSEMNRVIRIILNAKNSVMQEFEANGVTNAKYLLNISGNQSLSDQDSKALEELGIDQRKLQSEITNTLRRILNKMRKMSDNGTEFNTENYMFGAFKNMFRDYAEKEINEQETQLQRDEQAKGTAHKHNDLFKDPALKDFVSFVNADETN